MWACFYKDVHESSSGVFFENIHILSDISAYQVNTDISHYLLW